MLHTDEAGLLQADLCGPVNVFAGAGFSTLAKNASNRNLPSGDVLRDLIIEHFDRPDLKLLDLQSVYTIIQSGRRVELVDFLKAQLTAQSCFEDYDALRKLNISYFYTTNVDNLPNLIFRPIEGVSSPVLHDIILYGEPRDITASISYIPLHGSIAHENPNLVFTAGQIASAFQSDQQTWYVFQRELQRRPTFFLGYGMRDAGVLQALHNAAFDINNRWILLHEATDEARQLYGSLNFHIMEGSIADFLQHLDDSDFTIHQKIERPKLGGIPSRAEIAQRPVRNFFLGAEPEWSDAYSPQVTKRRIQSRAKNQLLQGKSVAIVGVPLSGKSTILRQLAVDLQDTRQCVFFDRLDENQAREILAEYAAATTKPIVFLDQFIDSREAFNILASAGGYKFAVAETAMFFDAINPKHLKAELQTLSCSEVPDFEFQAIIDSIPSDIKRADVSSWPDFDRDQVGLFEGLVQHVYDKDLKRRFRGRLADFEKKDEEAFDVYVMACYAHACRTLVSYDMIHLFTRTKDYSNVYKITARIGSFVEEVVNLDDDSQDHFDVRSGALARLALQEVNHEAFGRVFNRFHSNISSRVIPDFRTFRRYAYDNDFVRKAYRKVEDGRRFYQRLVALHGNAYDYQHGAIYLSKSGQFAEAFEWIDKARSLAGKNYAIRNSHAVILFDANIGVFENDPTNATAFEGLEQSMGVLRSCIEDDKFRRYHLLRYTDQAMRIARIVQTPLTWEWIEFADGRLEQTIKDAEKRGSAQAYNLGKFLRLKRTLERFISDFG
jgi:hypothetical protein